jgi:hypothetical protein
MTIRVTTAAALLAQMRARKEVKAQLMRKGEKVSHYSAREISLLAQQWLDAHQAEVMPECVEKAKAMMLSGALGKRAQRAALARKAVGEALVEIGRSYAASHSTTSGL